MNVSNAMKTIFKIFMLTFQLYTCEIELSDTIINK